MLNLPWLINFFLKIDKWGSDSKTYSVISVGQATPKPERMTLEPDLEPHSSRVRPNTGSLSKVSDSRTNDSYEATLKNDSTSQLIKNT